MLKKASGGAGGVLLDTINCMHGYSLPVVELAPDGEGLGGAGPARRMLAWGFARRRGIKTEAALLRTGVCGVRRGSGSRSGLKGVSMIVMIVMDGLFG